jgi:hypothetical protein
MLVPDVRRSRGFLRGDGVVVGERGVVAVTLI